MGKAHVELITAGDLKRLVGNRFNGQLKQTDINKVLEALVTEVEECIAEGSRVNLLNLVQLYPAYVKAKAKGEMVRNPFTGTTEKRKKGEPEKLKVKAQVLARANKAVPSARTVVGQATIKALAKKPKKKAGAR